MFSNNAGFCINFTLQDCWPSSIPRLTESIFILNILGYASSISKTETITFAWSSSPSLGSSAKVISSLSPGLKSGAVLDIIISLSAGFGRGLVWDWDALAPSWFVYSPLGTRFQPPSSLSNIVKDLPCKVPDIAPVLVVLAIFKSGALFGASFITVQCFSSKLPPSTWVCVHVSFE